MNNGHIYLVAIQDKITNVRLPYLKIGKAKVLRDRHSGLNDWPVKVPIANVYVRAWNIDDYHQVEAKLHKFFKEEKIEGEYHEDKVEYKVELMMDMLGGTEIDQESLDSLNARVLGNVMAGPFIGEFDDDYDKVMKGECADVFTDAMLAAAELKGMNLHRTNGSFAAKDNVNRLYFHTRKDHVLLELAGGFLNKHPETLAKWENQTSMTRSGEFVRENYFLRVTNEDLDKIDEILELVEWKKNLSPNFPS